MLLNQYFIGYFVCNFHSNWVLFLRVMQENNSGLILEHSVFIAPGRPGTSVYPLLGLTNKKVSCHISCNKKNREISRKYSQRLFYFISSNLFRPNIHSHCYCVRSYLLTSCHDMRSTLYIIYTCALT